MVCVYCNSNEIVKNGKVRKVQRFLCKKCGKNFTIKNNNNNFADNNNSNGNLDRFENNNIPNVQSVKNNGNNDNITLDSIIKTINESIKNQNEINEDIKEDFEGIKKIDENKIQLLKKVVELVYTFLLKLALKLVERYLNKRLRKDFDLNEFIKKAHSYVYDMLKEKGIIREDMEIDSTFMVIVIHLDLLLALEDIEDKKETNQVNEVKNETIIIPNQVQNVQLNQNINQIDLNQYRSLDI
ncbi:MAG: transposase [Minisyncoccia bacterium]|jgi:hypothetical protein